MCPISVFVIKKPQLLMPCRLSMPKNATVDGEGRAIAQKGGSIWQIVLWHVCGKAAQINLIKDEANWSSSSAAFGNVLFHSIQSKIYEIDKKK